MYQQPPPQGQQQPGGYPQQGPPMYQQMPPQRMPGGSPFVTAGIQLNPLERMAVLLMRIIAWIALLFVVIAACVSGIAILTQMGNQGNQGFQFLLTQSGTLIGQIASQVWGPAFLFGVAAIVESLAVIRNKA